MFRVFRLRSGREIVLYSPSSLFFPLIPLLPTTWLLMMCPWNAERDFISFSLSRSFPFLLVLPFIPLADLSFRFDSRVFPWGLGGYHRGPGISFDGPPDSIGATISVAVASFGTCLRWLWKIESPLAGGHERGTYSAAVSSVLNAAATNNLLSTFRNISLIKVTLRFSAGLRAVVKFWSRGNATLFSIKLS